jgi:hypothetical protein
MKYELEVNVTLRQENNYPGIQLRETVKVEADGFLKICEILALFHKLTEAVKK